jgi:hypothetical protein
MTRTVDFSYLHDPRLAAQYLATELGKGGASLVVGSGLSKSAGLGFPDWPTLITRLEGRHGLMPSASATYLSRMDTVRACHDADSSFYVELHEELYSDELRRTMTYPDSLKQAQLASAVVSMATGPGARIANILNLNFDDSLDWLLRDSAIALQTITTMPSQLQNDKVRVVHLHGFLPLTSHFQSSTRLVATGAEYDERLHGDHTNPWVAFLTTEFWSRTLLFIGASVTEDADIVQLVDRAFKAWRQERPVGFAVGVWDQPTRDWFEDHGIVAVAMADHSGTPEFLKLICRIARSAK